MFDKLAAMLGRADADYADLRYEQMKETRAAFSGRDLVTLSSSTTDGYVLRALKDGGLASVAFTRPEDAEAATKTAVENAQLIGRRLKKPVRLAPVEPARDRVRPELDEDPRSVTLDEKVDLLRKYNDLALANEKIVTTDLACGDVIREKYFVSTEGAEVNEELVTVRLAGTVVSKDGELTQTVRVRFGGSDGFGRLRNREADVERRVGIAVDLLKAEPVLGGTYRVVLDQSLAGVFTHEAFGHFSEADLIEDSPTMRAKMKIGARLGSEKVNIKDDPTMLHQLGFYRYDDEGVPARSTQLMKAGVLVGRLHSRRTAAAFGEPVSGHCIAEDYRYAPIIRMGNIHIEPGDRSLDDLLAELDDGLYLLNAMGGQTSGENFTFGAQFGYRYKGGKRIVMVRDINISGNLYHTLESIRAVAGDLELGEVGGCGKGQTNIRSSHGAPHVLVDDVVLGGR